MSMNRPHPSTTGPVSAATATARQWWPDDIRALVWDTLQAAEDDESTDIVERGDRVFAALHRHAVLRQAVLALAEVFATEAGAESDPSVYRTLDQCAARLARLAEVKP